MKFIINAVFTLWSLYKCLINSFLIFFDELYAVGKIFYIIWQHV